LALSVRARLVVDRMACRVHPGLVCIALARQLLRNLPTTAALMQSFAQRTRFMQCWQVRPRASGKQCDLSHTPRNYYQGRGKLVGMEQKMYNIIASRRSNWVLISHSACPGLSAKVEGFRMARDIHHSTVQTLIHLHVFEVET
jgi:hypothetical protein